MSIHPGLSGQELMVESLERVAQLRRRLPESVSVQVDGGVHLGDVAAVREAGANLLVRAAACSGATIWLPTTGNSSRLQRPSEFEKSK